MGDFAPPHSPPPMPSNFNCSLGSERGHKPIQEPGQAGTVPSSHCEKTAKAKKGRWGRGGRDTCPQAPRRGVEVEHEGSNGLIHRADPARPRSLGTPGSCVFLRQKDPPVFRRV